MASKELSKSGKIKWRPKEWKIEYDRVVGYSALGLSNVAVAEKMGFTPEHVSTILNLPQAQELLSKLKAKLRDTLEKNIPEALDEIANAASKRLREVVQDTELAKKAPFQMANLSLDLLKGIGHMKGAQPQVSSFGIVNNGTMVLMPNQKSDIMDGLQKVAEVRQLHAGNPDPNRNGQTK